MKIDIDPLLSACTWDSRGLIPVITQDRGSGVVRMFAWANAQAVRATATTGYATFFSRSRNTLWEKGATSGHRLSVREIRLDCDGDGLLYLCDAEGPSCHEGTTSCFSRRATEQDGLSRDDGPPAIGTAIDSDASVITRVAAVIASREGQDPKASYVASLLSKGFAKVREKIDEEARELGEALPQNDRAHTAHEAADLLFHVLVGLHAARVPVTDVFAELQRRFGTSGHAEKASRLPPPSRKD